MVGNAAGRCKGLRCVSTLTPDMLHRLLMLPFCRMDKLYCLCSEQRRGDAGEQVSSRKVKVVDESSLPA